MMLFVHQHIARERYAICKACDLLEMKFCKDCKCFMPAKVRFTYAECPKNKWGKVQDGQPEEYDLGEDL